MAFEQYKAVRGRHAHNVEAVRITKTGYITFSRALADRFALTVKSAVCIYYNRDKNRLAFEVHTGSVVGGVTVYYKDKKSKRLMISGRGMFQYFDITPAAGEYTILKGRKPNEFQIQLGKETPRPKSVKRAEAPKIKKTPAQRPVTGDNAVFRDTLRSLIKEKPYIKCDDILKKFVEDGTMFGTKSKRELQRKIHNRVKNDPELESTGRGGGFKHVSYDSDRMLALKGFVTTVLDDKDAPMLVNDIQSVLAAKGRDYSMREIQDVLRDTEHFEYVPSEGYVSKIPMTEL